ncbi:protein of unknown function [Candidatus Nitrotoga arctica]|uniref:Uncharacterized protein n=2 Tax=Candidatus Nitrotoga arctica TaxID=453162 RepID=A0ABN8AN06_9PROT|nr:protein of unknown function [Candidatus Nitrotoga arctica]
MDVSPEVLKFWMISLTGGAGHAAMDVINLPSKTGDGVFPHIRDLPIARRFLREAGVSDTRATFWNKRWKQRRPTRFASLTGRSPGNRQITHS